MACHRVAVAVFVIWLLIPCGLPQGSSLPKNIINQLANGITKDKFLNPKEDSILPIVDIIRRSIKIKYDSETVKVGLKKVTEQVTSIIDPYVETNISDDFCNYLQGLSKLVMSETDEKLTIEVIINLEKFGKDTAEKRLEDATKKAISSLKVVGITAAERGKELEEATLKVMKSLEAVGIAAMKKWYLFCLSEIVHNEEQQKKFLKHLQTVDTRLSQLIENAVYSSDGNERIKIIKSGNTITLEIKNDSCYLKRILKKNQKRVKILQKYIKKRVLRGVNQNSLKRENVPDIKIGVVMHEDGKQYIYGKVKELDDVTWQVATSLEAVGKAAAKKKELETVTWQVAESLEYVGKAAAKKGKELKKTTKQVAESLKCVGKAAADNRLKRATDQAVSSLENVEKAVMENWHLFSLSEIVNNEKQQEKFLKYLQTIDTQLSQLIENAVYSLDGNERIKIIKDGNTIATLGIENDSCYLKRENEADTKIGVAIHKDNKLYIYEKELEDEIKQVISFLKDVREAAEKTDWHKTQPAIHVIVTQGSPFTTNASL